MTEIEPAISSSQTARVLGVSVNTPGVWRVRGEGPPIHYSGAKPVYYLSEVKAWQAECTAAAREKQAARAAAAAAIGGRKRGRPKAATA